MLGWVSECWVLCVGLGDGLGVGCVGGLDGCLGVGC